MLKSEPSYIKIMNDNLKNLLGYVASGEEALTLIMNDSIASVEVIDGGRDYRVLNVVNCDSFRLKEVVKVKRKEGFLDIEIDSGERYELRLFAHVGINFSEEGDAA